MSPEICQKSIKGEITKYTHESLHEIENDVESKKIVGTKINIRKDGEKKLLYSALTATVLPFFPCPGLIHAGIDFRKLRLATEIATVM